MSKPNDRVFLALCAAAGLAILLGCALPTFELYLFASIGGGDDQQVFDYRRELRLLTYPVPGALVFPVTGAALAGTGLYGALRGPRPWVVAVAIALTIPAFVQVVRTLDLENSSESGGVSVCDEPRLEGCIYYLAPAARDFREHVMRKPEARRRGYDPPEEGAYNITRLAGWQPIGWAAAIISLTAWFRAILFVAPRLRWAFLIYAGLLIVVFVWVVSWWLRNWYP